MEQFIGKSVSIHCANNRGIFQGTIAAANPAHLTLVRAFCNGLPVATPRTEITIKATDILNLRLLATDDAAAAAAAAAAPTPPSDEDAPDASRSSNGNGYSQQQPPRLPAIASQSYRHSHADPENFGYEALREAVANAASPVAGGRSGANGPEMVALMMQRSRIDNGGGPGVPMTYPDTVQIPSPLTVSVSGGVQPSQRKQRQKSSSAAGVNKTFGNLIPKQVEAMLTAIPSTSTAQSHIWQQNAAAAAAAPHKPPPKSASVSASVAIPSASNAASQWPAVGPQPPPPSQRISSNRKTAAYNRNQAFSAGADDPLQLDEEFDFEGNLALFDKAAIWTQIDAIQQPEMMRQTAMVKPAKNYRHDENILAGVPAQSRRQITGNATAAATAAVEFTTDEGLVIPCVPAAQRSAVRLAAHAAGLTLGRQSDMLARGTAELALQLLGGARRLVPQNQHQWPLIVVVVDAVVWSEPQAETGLATARALASHGLKVCVWAAADAAAAVAASGRTESVELELFEACGANVMHTGRVKDLPPCDLIVLSLKAALGGPIARWVNESRAPTLAIDPPVGGGGNGATDAALPCGVSVKHAVLPVLPVHGIEAGHGGKLYLCNLGIPERFYVAAGIQFRSPFGHKFVIAIHPLAVEEGAVGGQPSSTKAASSV